MTSTITRTVAAILAMLAFAAPVASAMPLRDHDDAPAALTKPTPATDDGGPSRLVFVVPSLALVAMLGAAVIYTRSSRPARV